MISRVTVPVVFRFNFVLPGFDPVRLSAMYRAAVEMAQYGESRGLMAVGVEEHHTGDDGWGPAPLTAAGVMLGATSTLRVLAGAVLIPLHDPIRVAESIAVLDLAGGGRLNVIAGLGYRPEEYATAGVPWEGRGALLDESLDAILAAWSGEEFTYRGRTLKISPVPLSHPRALLSVGGSGKPAARRAARLGLNLITSRNSAELKAYYEEQCALHGTTPMIMMPAEGSGVQLLAEDPDRAWAEIGEHLLYEARRYAGWNAAMAGKGGGPSIYSQATTVEQLRTEGVYQILTPEQAVEKARTAGGTLAFHPMCGGVPPEKAWETVQLAMERVVPMLSATPSQPQTP